MGACYCAELSVFGSPGSRGFAPPVPSTLSWAPMTARLPRCRLRYQAVTSHHVPMRFCRSPRRFWWRWIACSMSRIEDLSANERLTSWA